MADKNTGCDDFDNKTNFKFKFVLFPNEQELLGENDTAVDFISKIPSECVLHNGTTVRGTTNQFCLNNNQTVILH